MGMYDTICSEQVKCFNNLLDHYEKGDTVPTVEFGYDSNLIIMPFCTILSDDWKYDSFIIIKDNKVMELKNIIELNEEDFNDITQVISYRGGKTKIKNLNDLFEYIEDAQIAKIKDDINDIKGIYTDTYQDFSDKWIIK